MKWIDSHVHAWSADVEKYPFSSDQAPLQPRDFSPEVILRHARPSDVLRVVLVYIGIYGDDHSLLFDTVERFPDVFRVVGRVDPSSDRVADEMEGQLERGVTGFRITAPLGEGKGWLQEPGYDAMFEAAARTGQAVCPLMHPDGIADLDRMCGEHQDTTVVIDHMARIGEADPASDDQIDALCSLARYSKVHVKISRLHALGNKRPPHTELAPMIRRVVEAFGSERVMWGSDAPFQVVDESYEDSISLVRDKLDFLTDSDRDNILRGTAERVFFWR